MKLSLLQLNNSCKPYCPSEFVGNVIAGLSKEFDATGICRVLTKLWKIIERTLNSIAKATNWFKPFHRPL